MNNLTSETKTIFNNCNKRIVIGSLRPWCEREYYKFIDLNLEKIEKNPINTILEIRCKDTKICANTQSISNKFKIEQNVLKSEKNYYFCAFKEKQ